MPEDKKTLRDQQEYNEFISPLINGIGSAIEQAMVENPDKKYTEFDIYNGLLFTLSSIERQDLNDDMKQEVREQSEELAKQLAQTGLIHAQENKLFYSSMILGLARSAMIGINIIEEALEQELNTKEEE